MKKFIATLFAGLLVSVACAEIYDRAVVTVGDGAAMSWTNDNQYTSAKLIRIWQQTWNASNDLTVTRVTSDGLYTNSVATIVVGTSVPRSSTPSGAAYLAYGDKLVITPNPLTGGVVIVEFEVQR